VRTKSRVARIDPDYVRDHRQSQLYSALAWDCIGRNESQVQRSGEMRD